MALPNGWAYRVQLVINRARVISAETNVPVLLYWTGTASTSNLPLAMFNSTFPNICAQSTGADVRISTDALGLSECPLEIAKFSTSAGGTGITGQIWTKLPSVSTTADTTFFAWWQNPTATAYAVNATYGRNNVWTNSYVSVYHLETAATNPVTNSVGTSQYDGTTSNVTALTTGQISGDGTWNRTSSFIACADQDITVGTWSAWGRPDPTQVAYAKLVNKSTVSGAPWTQYNLTYDNGTPKLFGTEIAVGTTQYSAGKVAALTANAWHFLAGRYNGGNLTCWIDGTQSGTRTDITGSLATNDEAFNIGRSSFSGAAASEWWSGQIDEVRVQNAARSDGWIRTEYNMITAPQTFITQYSPNYNGPLSVRFQQTPGLQGI